MNEILCLSAGAQGRLLREGKLSSVELVQAHLNRIGETNPRLHAAVETLGESALAAARASDSRPQPLSALDGVPFSVKDSIEVAGTGCTAGTLGFRNAAPSACDATLVARLRAAGAIPIAKTNLPDLLFSFETDNLIYGRTNNPYDVERTPGGSSGGEAALIADCGSPMGLGSDAAGSVRLPAHFCGIAALKPTSGRLSRAGHVPPASGWLEAVWQIGPMARRVEDLIAMMPILLGEDPRDRTQIPMPYGDPRALKIAGLRAAFFAGNGIAAADPDTAGAVRAAAEALARDGAAVEERTPPGASEAYDLEMQMIGPDGGDGLREYLAAIGSDRIHPLLESWLRKLEPYRTDMRGFARFWERLDAFRAAMQAFIGRFDVIVSPVSASAAIPHGASADDSVFRGFSYTMTYNLTGWPAAVVRWGRTASGLPVGVQIAARPWREDVALAVALRLEEISGGWQPAPTA